MRKLKESYWNKFKKRDKKGRDTRDGILFEDLVMELLKLKYPGEWTRTRKSHDDNRDFYLITNDSRIWAECKNYEQSIALDTIAPTLVMAQIYSANKIIFFSYSKINRMAHRKLYSFATSTQKQIEIFEEEQLDQLIIENNLGLSKKFQVSLDDISTTLIMPEIDIQFSIIRTPMLGTSIEDDDITPYDKVDKILYNNAFEVLIFVDFNKVVPELSVEISASQNYNSDSNYVILEDSRIEFSNYVFMSKLQNVTGYVKSILVKPLFFKSSTNLPVFNVNIYSQGSLIASAQSPFVSVKYVWNKQTPLIGTEYRKAINILDNHILNFDTLGCFLVVGVSGTGKTKRLKESLDSLLMHKYRIINFVGKEKDSARTLLKELIYFIYEIPRAEIFEYLDECIEDIENQKAFPSDIPNTYNLIKKISGNISDHELINLIDNYFSIIFEKMSNEHMALVIDNVQDFGEPLRYFLDKYINYSRHQSRSNRSILLLSINIDKADKNTLNFIESIQELQNDYDTFYVHETSGFNISSQALIFLKELLNEKTGRFDKELEQVINRYSTIPYYLWQFVYNLLDNDIAYYDENNKCRIKDPTKFFDVTLELHDPKELLRKRWSRLLDRSLFEEQDYIRILSLISLIPNVQESTIRDFNLKFSCLDILTKYNFIRKNRSGNYVFDHDIVERFMVEYYGSHYFIILEHIKIEGLERQIINRPFISNLYKINQKDISVAEVKEVADYVYDNKPSLLFMKPFLEMLIKQINANIENFNGNEEWLNYIVRTCNILRNNIGFDESLDYYETINNVIIKKGVANFSRTITFRNYIDTYSDLLHHIRRSDEAITYLKSILTKLPKLEDDDIANALYSMIYNRLLINYREYESVQARYDVIECYNKSIDYAMHIQDKNLRNEFIYLNQSDLGYIYYSIKENKEELLKIWKECLNFPPEILPQKTLNYYRKMVQISLINQNVENAEKNILFIRKHLNEISYTAEHMIFDMFCLMSESICLILKNPVANYTELKSIFVELMRISRLRGGKRIYEILNLKAIVAYYNEDYDTMEESFKKAYELMRNAKPTMHLSVKRAFLVNNIIYAYQSLNKNSSIKNIVEDYIDKELMDDYSAQSILYTPDEKFNFMPIV